MFILFLLTSLSSSLNRRACFNFFFLNFTILSVFKPAIPKLYASNFLVLFQTVGTQNWKQRAGYDSTLRAEGKQPAGNRCVCVCIFTFYSSSLWSPRRSTSGVTQPAELRDGCSAARDCYQPRHVFLCYSPSRCCQGVGGTAEATRGKARLGRFIQ